MLFTLWLGYLAPWLVAEAREHEDRNRILLVNMLLGWTVVGWIGTFYWARSTPAHTDHRPVLRVIPGPVAPASAPGAGPTAALRSPLPPGARPAHLRRV